MHHRPRVFKKAAGRSENLLSCGMRVANLIEEGKLGGPQVRMVRVARALAGRVETLIVLPFENSGAFRELCESQHVAYRVLPLTRVTKEWRVAIRYLLFSWLEVIQLVRLFKREKVQLVHVSGGSWQVKGVLAARIAGVPSLWHLNDTSMPGFVRRIFHTFNRFASGFVFASERSREYYKSLIQEGRPSFVIPAPVNTADFDPAVAIAGDEEAIGRWAGKIVIGTTANVSPVKGLETFVRVAARLNRQFDNLVFVCVGKVYKNQRRYYDRLVGLCKELGVSNIEFAGSRAEVRPLLKRFDTYLCTSVAESSPLSVWEAMSMTKPIVSTDVGDVPVYVKDGECGYVVEVGDDEALATRAAVLVRDPELRELLGQNARRVAVEKLDLSLCAERHLAAYRTMVDANASGMLTTQ